MIAKLQINLMRFKTINTTVGVSTKLETYSIALHYFGFESLQFLDITLSKSIFQKFEIRMLSLYI